MQIGKDGIVAAFKGFEVRLDGAIFIRGNVFLRDHGDGLVLVAQHGFLLIRQRAVHDVIAVDLLPFLR